MALILKTLAYMVNTSNTDTVNYIKSKITVFVTQNVFKANDYFMLLVDMLGKTLASSNKQSDEVTFICYSVYSGRI